MPLYQSTVVLATPSAALQTARGRTRGTDLWLHDTDKNFSTDLTLAHCLRCMKFGQLILRKIITIVATGCQIMRLKCTKFDFGRGSTAPDPTGQLTALPRPASWM